jgi:hypothetical protein
MPLINDINVKQVKIITNIQHHCTSSKKKKISGYILPSIIQKAFSFRELRLLTPNQGLHPEPRWG